MIESKYYEQLQILRTHWLNDEESLALSEDDLIALAELYNTDAEFKAFCAADQELRDAMPSLAYFVAPAQRMREYFEKFRDFCYGRSKLHDSPHRILSFYHIDGSSFRTRCDDDTVVSTVITQWVNGHIPDPNM